MENASAKRSGEGADWRIEKATNDDFDAILEFMFGDFMLTEPLNECMNVNNEDAIDFFGDIIKCALSPPIVSYVVRNEKDVIIAVRLSYLLHRSKPDDGAAFDQCSSAKLFPYNIQQIMALLHKLESQIWDKVPPDVDCLISWLILSVDKRYKRKGIANALLHHRLEELKREYGCQGAVTEASAYNSQQLFRKLGYEPLYEILHSEWRDENGSQIFKCRDATDRVTLDFKRF